MYIPEDHVFFLPGEIERLGLPTAQALLSSNPADGFSGVLISADG